MIRMNHIQKNSLKTYFLEEFKKMSYCYQKNKDQIHQIPITKMKKFYKVNNKPEHANINLFLLFEEGELQKTLGDTVYYSLLKALKLYNEQNNY